MTASGKKITAKTKEQPKWTQFLAADISQKI